MSDTPATPPPEDVVHDEVELDPTHPLAFGYRNELLPVFRNSRLLLQDGDEVVQLLQASVPAELTEELQITTTSGVHREHCE